MKSYCKPQLWISSLNNEDVLGVSITSIYGTGENSFSDTYFDYGFGGN